MSDKVTVPCEKCHGEGTYVRPFPMGNFPNGEMEYKCDACNGLGLVQVEVEPPGETMTTTGEVQP